MSCMKRLSYAYGIITALTAALTAAPLLARAQGKTPSSGSLARLLQPAVDSHEIAGAVVLVANKDKVVDVETIGYADLAAKIPMRANDEFWIASMSKAMTASALMMLVDEGKVDLDDPVEKYLPEFKKQMVRAVKPASIREPGEYHGALVRPNHPPTIREILCHTAGLPFRSSVLEGEGALDQHPLAEAVHAYAAEPLAYQPGTDYSYSNEGINIAGRIVEVISGMPYEAFMQQRLFDTLEMTDTTFWPTQEQISRLAKTYRVSSSGLVKAPLDQLSLPLDDRAHRYPVPAGGLFSTAHDVMLFMQMLLNRGVFRGRRLLSEASVHEMTKIQNKGLENSPYGFGLNIGPDKYGHSGAFKTSMQAFPNTGTILIFMVQVSGEFNGKFLRQLEPAAQEIVAVLPAK